MPEHEHKVYNSLINESKVLEIRPLYREYDLLAKIKTSNKQKFGDFVSNKIRSLKGVIDTKTIQ